MTHSAPEGRILVEEKDAEDTQRQSPINPADSFGEQIRPTMPEDPYALSTAWAKGHEFKKPFDHIIENSGQKVKLRRLDMGDLLKLGVAEELDFMTKGLMSEDNPKDSAK